MANVQAGNQPNIAAGHGGDQQPNIGAGQRGKQQRNIAASQGGDQQPNIAASQGGEQQPNIAASQGGEQQPNIAATQGEDQQPNIAATQRGGQQPNIAAGQREEQQPNIAAAQGGDQQPNIAAGQGGDQPNIAEDETIESNLEDKIEKLEENILKMEASVFQLANYYFVFQGVILSAIIKGSSGGLKCDYFWLPLSLSVVGATLNFGSLFILAHKYKISLDELDRKSMMLYKCLSPDNYDSLSREHQKQTAWRELIMKSSMLLFLIFVALNLFATWLIPCRG